MEYKCEKSNLLFQRTPLELNNNQNIFFSSNRDKFCDSDVKIGYYCDECYTQIILGKNDT